jgi:hypothetical protein
VNLTKKENKKFCCKKLPSTEKLRKVNFKEKFNVDLGQLPFFLFPFFVFSFFPFIFFFEYHSFFTSKLDALSYPTLCVV